MALMMWHRTKQIANSTTHIRSVIKTEGNHLSTEDGILMLEIEIEGQTFRRIVLPTNEGVTVLQTFHDENGHFGPDKTSEMIKRKYFWFGWKHDTKEWCQSCVTCAKRKNPTRPDKQSQGTINLHNQPLNSWNMDFAGPLPTTDRQNKYIFAFTDPFSKWVEAFAVKDQTVETTASVVF